MRVDFDFAFPLHENQYYNYDRIARFIYRENDIWHYAECPFSTFERGSSDVYIPGMETLRLLRSELAVSGFLPSVVWTGYSRGFSAEGKFYDYARNGNLNFQGVKYLSDFPASPNAPIVDPYFYGLFNTIDPDIVDGELMFRALNIDGVPFSHIPGFTAYGNNNTDKYVTPSVNLVQSLDIYFDGELYEERPDEDIEYGETSGPGGGAGGSFDNASDSVDFASLPSGGAAASGLVTMFAPTPSQMSAFGNFLWATLFDANFDSFLTSLKKWVNDPIESVIQLAAYPVTPPSGSAVTLKFCGIRSDLVGTGVSMNKCTSQFMDFDFGQITTPAYWKQALDYSPYTKVSIYLPYIGICPLASDDVIDATLQLKYHIDLLTGGFSAELKVTKNIAGTSLSSVLYNWSGNMATQIPITSANFSQVFGSMMTAVAAIGVGAITGGMGAAAAGGGAEAAGSAAIAGGALSGAGHGLAANIGNVINSKPHVTQSGRLDGTVGALSQFTPYLIIERPVQSLSSKFQEEQGYPSNVVQRLGDLSGMTVCEAPIMTGFSGATEEEKDAIRALLCGGVIL